MGEGASVPDILYHGTTALFEAFSKDGVEPRYDNPQADLGFFFRLPELLG